MVTMDSFCPELLDNIFCFLPKEDLWAVSKVSSAWNQIARLSFRRRVSFQERSAGGFTLQIRNFEPQNPSNIVFPPESTEETLEATWAKSGVSLFDEDEGHPDLSLLAVMEFQPEWCDRITELDFSTQVTFETLNAAGSSIFELFKSLRRIRFRKLKNWHPEEDNQDETSASMFLELAPEIKTGILFKTDPRDFKWQWQGELCFQLQVRLQLTGRKRKREELLLLAVAAMHEHWCSKITKLVIDGDLKMQNWDIAGSLVSNKFKRLEKLEVNLEWKPDYVPVIEVSEDFRRLRLKGTGGSRRLEMDHGKSDLKQPLLMLMNMSADACNKITQLGLMNDLAVQDWNVVGSYVLSKFTSLKWIHLGLIFVPGYVSTLESSELPAEGATFNIETIHLQLEDTPDWEPQAPRLQLAADFVARCPNLKFLSANYQYQSDDDCACIRYINYDWFCDEKVTFSSRDHCSECEVTITEDISASFSAALTPLLNKLEFTTLGLEGVNSLCQLQGLQNFITVESLKNLELLVIHLPLLLDPTKQEFRCLVNLLNPGGCGESLENLELVGDRECNLDQHVPGEFDNSAQLLQLPKVKRLTVSNFAGTKFSSQQRLFYDSLAMALPNIEEMTVEFSLYYDENGKTCFRHFAEICEFFEYSPVFTKLKSLTWNGKGEGAEDPEETRWLSAVQENLAKHQTLETLTVSWNLHQKNSNEETVLEIFKAIVKGCAVAPSVRTLKVTSRNRSAEMLQLWFNQQTRTGSIRPTDLKLEIDR